MNRGLLLSVLLSVSLACNIYNPISLTPTSTVDPPRPWYCKNSRQVAPGRPEPGIARKGGRVFYCERYPLLKTHILIVYDASKNSWVSWDEYQNGE